MNKYDYNDEECEQFCNCIMCMHKNDGLAKICKILHNKTGKQNSIIDRYIYTANGTYYMKSTLCNETLNIYINDTLIYNYSKDHTATYIDPVAVENGIMIWKYGTVPISITDITNYSTGKVNALGSNQIYLVEDNEIYVAVNFIAVTAPFSAHLFDKYFDLDDKCWRIV